MKFLLYQWLKTTSFLLGSCQRLTHVYCVEWNRLHKLRKVHSEKYELGRTTRVTYYYPLKEVCAIRIRVGSSSFFPFYCGLGKCVRWFKIRISLWPFWNLEYVLSPEGLCESRTQWGTFDSLSILMSTVITVSKSSPEICLFENLNMFYPPKWLCWNRTRMSSIWQFFSFYCALGNCVWCFKIRVFQRSFLNLKNILSTDGMGCEVVFTCLCFRCSTRSNRKKSWSLSRLLPT